MLVVVAFDLLAKGADILQSLSMLDWGPLQWRMLLGSKLHRRSPLRLACVYMTARDAAEATLILSKLSQVWIQQPIWLALWMLLASKGLSWLWATPLAVCMLRSLPVAIHPT